MSSESDSSTELLKRYAAILQELATAATASGRDPRSISLVAVSKVHSYEKIRTLYESGQRDFGENYVQELVDKALRAISDGLTEIRWHFIGHLQTNKVKLLLPHVFLIHGIDSLRLAEEVSRRAASRVMPVLIEVNIDDQKSKSGVQISDLRGLVEKTKLLPGIQIKGLMCIPDPAAPGGSSAAFRRLSDLGVGLGINELSMGMTADFKEAIAMGATWIRVGSAIFGERSPREKL